MPLYPRDRHDTVPFLSADTTPPSTPWRSKAKDLHRRSGVLKRVAGLIILLAFAVPIWMITHNAQEPIAEAQVRPVAPSPAIHAPWPPSAHRHAGVHPNANSEVGVPAVHDDSGLAVEAVEVATQAVVVEEEPVTFALLMWSEDSASEGVILIKSILMYASGPIHIHVICDEAAQTYLQKRLALVQRPKYDFLIKFYRPSYEEMAARVEREGAISSIHSAGIVGLMKLFIHELLPPTVKRAIFVDTDAFFISDPLLLWQQFSTFNSTTAISMPSHPDQSSTIWLDANKICSCVMLLDLERLRALRLMDSSLYPHTGSAEADAPRALSPPAFAALFGAPDPATGKYRDVWLGDQSFWWAIVRARPDVYQHLSYDFEVSSCLYDMYITGLGEPDADEAAQVERQQDRVRDTPSEGQAVVPRLLHFNCLSTDKYFDWEGWNDPEDSLNQRWGTAVRYHAGYKWTWLNQAPAGAGTRLVIETVEDVQFADVLYAQAHEGSSS